MSASKNTTNPKILQRIIDIKGKELTILFVTGIV